MGFFVVHSERQTVLLQFSKSTWRIRLWTTKSRKIQSLNKRIKILWNHYFYWQISNVICLSHTYIHIATVRDFSLPIWTLTQRNEYNVGTSSMISSGLCITLEHYVLSIDAYNAITFLCFGIFSVLRVLHWQCLFQIYTCNMHNLPWWQAYHQFLIELDITQKRLKKLHWRGDVISPSLALGICL